MARSASERGRWPGPEARRFCMNFLRVLRLINRDKLEAGDQQDILLSHGESNKTLKRQSGFFRHLSHRYLPLGLAAVCGADLLQSCNGSADLKIIQGLFFAKLLRLCFNTDNFLKQEVGPGIRDTRTGAL
jgi:hypothetical protein